MSAVRKTKSRWSLPPVDQRTHKSPPPYDHPALIQGRTIYPSTVQVPERDHGMRVLKSGENSAKIGAIILKRPWRDFPVFTISLEERRTCPRDCALWRTCYGNHMHWAERWQAGPELEWRLEREVALLATLHPHGFVIRLHILGDFFSVGYVALWRTLLERHPALHCFGFTARSNVADPIAAALAELVKSHWDRFAIRFSNPRHLPFQDARTAVTFERNQKPPPGAIVCPQQLGKTESCSTCGLCWHGKPRTIAFILH